MGGMVTPAATDPQSDQALDALISLASASAGWTERDARYLLDKIDRLQSAGTWTRRLKGEPRTWDRFCCEVLGYEAGYVEKIREGVALLQQRGVQKPSVRQAEEARSLAEMWEKEQEEGRGVVVREIGLGKSGPGRGNKTVNAINRFRADKGPTSEYLAARIARDHPGILERMKAGEFKSVRQAALEAGIIKPRISIPLDPHKAAEAIRRHFTPAEVAEIARLLHWSKEE